MGGVMNAEILSDEDRPMVFKRVIHDEERDEFAFEAWTLVWEHPWLRVARKPPEEGGSLYLDYANDDAAFRLLDSDASKVIEEAIFRNAHALIPIDPIEPERAVAVLLAKNQHELRRCEALLRTIPPTLTVRALRVNDLWLAIRRKGLEAIRSRLVEEVESLTQLWEGRSTGDTLGSLPPTHTSLPRVTKTSAVMKVLQDMGIKKGVSIGSSIRVEIRQRLEKLGVEVADNSLRAILSRHSFKAWKTSELPPEDEYRIK